mmetsp:Transcript_21568/g.73980  ORF Transcript_21568/g.73980 Transcript_21568/m.73980 type:complete len:110 (-) Transcript_21568:82-411(-)
MSGPASAKPLPPLPKPVLSPPSPALRPKARAPGKALVPPPPLLLRMLPGAKPWLRRRPLSLLPQLRGVQDLRRQVLLLHTRHSAAIGCPVVRPFDDRLPATERLVCDTI